MGLFESMPNHLKSTAPQFLRYLIVGISSVAIYIAGLNALVDMFHLAVPWANAISFVASTAFNYVLNYHWVFSSKKQHSDSSPRFLVVAGSGIILNSVTVGALVTIIGVRPTVAALGFSLMWPLVSYLGMKFWAFKN